MREDGKVVTTAIRHRGGAAMSVELSPLVASQEELDQTEELIRYLVAHDGRLPTDDVSLSWWLIEALEKEKGHPIRKLLAGIPLTKVGRGLTPKKAHAWSVWFARYDQLIWIHRRDGNLDDSLLRDKILRDWFNDKLVRYQIGTLGVVERVLLDRNPLWDSSREPNTRDSRGKIAFRFGLTAVRDFYAEHGHVDIPEGLIAGFDLHQWWGHQRALYANPGGGGMKEQARQQFAALAKTGIDLRTDKERARVDPVFRHRDKLKKLASHVAERGMSALPDSARVWVDSHHKGTLSPELRVALEAIEGWSWPEREPAPADKKPRAPKPHVREPIRSVRTDIADPDTVLNRPGLRQFLPAD